MSKALVDSDGYHVVVATKLRVSSVPQRVVRVPLRVPKGSLGAGGGT